jgi:hypothetical protein
MFQKLRKCKRAVSSTAIAGVAVSALLVAILMPIALTEIANVTTTGWETSVVTVFQVVLPILMVVGLALKYIPKGE